MRQERAPSAGETGTSWSRADNYTLLWLLLLLLPLIVVGAAWWLGWDMRRAVFGSTLTCWPLAHWMRTRAKKLSAATATQAMAVDRRPPVVYLRSFAADRADDVRRGLQTALLSRHMPRPSAEERLVERLRQAGPVVALGRPGEALAQLGAARMYVPDAEWQTEVDDLLARAGIVVLRVGETPGLAWELAEIVRRDRPEVLLVFMPSPSEYPAFRRWANALLPRPLPGEWTKEYMIFAGDWTAETPTPAWWRRHGITSPP